MKYTNILLMTALSFISMYILMYIMVDSYSNVYMNLNQFYMAGLMTIPMLIIELLLMWSMYANKMLNILILGLSSAIFVLFIIFIRQQTAIGDKEFLKSMIPHHAAAILMCNKAKLQDPEIKDLCKNIGKTQLDEINFMKKKLERYES